MRGLSPIDFARQYKCSPTLIGDILSGKARLDSETATLFEKALGLDAGIWLEIESNYRVWQEETHK